MTWLEQFFVGNIGILNASTLLGAVIYAVIFLALTWLASRSLRLLLEGAIKRDKKGIIDRTASRFFMQVLRVVMFVLAVTAYFHVIPPLRAFGTVLLAGVSVASVIFGLAASNTLSNLIAGVSLLMYFPYRVGDQVRLSVAGSAETSTIESINLGYTQLRASNGETIVVPNSVMIANAVVLLKKPA
jgi:small-conductance mechanosensitive channel